MNPYDYVTGDIVEAVERVLDSAIGHYAWDGIQNPADLLIEAAGSQLTEQYHAAVEGSAEDRYRVAFLPRMQQFLHGWDVNSRVDQLAIFAGVVSSLNKPTISVGDLGCGSGQLTNMIGQLIRGDVIGFDRMKYWDQPLGPRFSNASFEQRDIFDKPPRQFDIIFTHGLKDCDASRLWQAMAKWCCLDGLVFVNDGPVDVSSGNALLSSLDGMKKLSPLACVPVGGPHSDFKPDDPGVALICRRSHLKDDLAAKCSQLVKDYRRLVKIATPYLNDESIPYRNRTFSKFILHQRSQTDSD